MLLLAVALAVLPASPSICRPELSCGMPADGCPMLSGGVEGGVPALSGPLLACCAAPEARGTSPAAGTATHRSADVAAQLPVPADRLTTDAVPRADRLPPAPFPGVDSPPLYTLHASLLI